MLGMQTGRVWNGGHGHGEVCLGMSMGPARWERIIQTGEEKQGRKDCRETLGLAAGSQKEN